MIVAEAIQTATLAIARSYLGIEIKEDPPGSNEGFWVELFQEAVGLNEGDAWCMAFIYMCSREAYKMYGLETPLLRTGWCKGQWLHAEKHPLLGVIYEENLVQIPRGSIWIRFDGAGKGHAGFALSHNLGSGLMRSLEGNASNGVRVRTYNVSEIKDFKGAIVLKKTA